jgi:hypothetical protein
MWVMMAAASASYLAMVNDPEAARYCVAAAEAEQALQASYGDPDDYFAAVAGGIAKNWRQRLVELGAADEGALALTRQNLSDTGPDGIGYAACYDLVAAAPADGDLVAAARDLDAAGVKVAMGGPLPIDLASMDIPHVMRTEDPDMVIMPGMQNVLACYGLLSAIARNLPAGSEDRKMFETGLARIDYSWPTNLYHGADPQAELKAAAAGFDTAAFEALSEADGETRMRYCFRVAGLE